MKPHKLFYLYLVLIAHIFLIVYDIKNVEPILIKSLKEILNKNKNLVQNSQKLMTEEQKNALILISDLK